MNQKAQPRAMRWGSKGLKGQMQVYLLLSSLLLMMFFVCSFVLYTGSREVLEKQLSRQATALAGALEIHFTTAGGDQDWSACLSVAQQAVVAAAFEEQYLLFTPENQALLCQEEQILTSSGDELGFSAGLTQALDKDTHGIIRFTQNNTKLLGCLTTVKDSGWQVLAFAPQRSVWLAAMRQGLPIWGMLLLLLVVLPLLWRHACRKWLWPLQQIKEQAVAAAAGDFSVAVETNLQGELGQFAEAIGRITQVLQQMMPQLAQNAALQSTTITTLQNKRKDFSNAVSQQKTLYDSLTHCAEALAVNFVDTGRENASVASGLQQAEEQLRESSRQLQHLWRQISLLDTTTREIQLATRSTEEVSFQTHILSILANVEAVSMEENVAGFRVIAQEIKQLAAESSLSALNAKHAVKQMGQIVEEGLRLQQLAVAAVQNIQIVVERSRQQVAGLQTSLLSGEHLTAQLTTNLALTDPVMISANAVEKELEQLCSAMAQQYAVLAVFASKWNQCTFNDTDIIL